MTPNSRSYLNRWVQPDSIIPDPYNPKDFDRYAYVENDPVNKNDPTGHCWGILSFMRDSAGYGATCNNLDMAWKILTTDQTTLVEKAGAAGYIAVEGAAHIVAAAGAAVVVCGTVSEACLAGLTAAPQAMQNLQEVAQPAINIVKTLLNGVTKIDAKDALRGGIDGLSNGQTQKALELLNKGKIDSFTINSLENDLIQVISDRAGRDGFQRFIYTIDPSGKVIQVIQQAFNAAGELVHDHDKINNIIR